MSDHSVPVVPVHLNRHPNADSLSVIPVFGYSYVGRTEEWEKISLGAYISPDSLVDPSRPEFAFLKNQARSDGLVRIKAKKLRGIVSFGLMVPAPEGSKEGDDVAERLGVKHYEPPLDLGNSSRVFLGGEAASGPNLVCPKYDLENLRRYPNVIPHGTKVFLTEKLDGTNARYVWHGGEMYCGSRTEWKREYPSYDHVTLDGLKAQGVDETRAAEIVEKVHSKPKPQNLWWKILRTTPELEKFCRDNPDDVVYGEVYGPVGRIKYHAEPRLAAFDILNRGTWVNHETARGGAGQSLPWAPIVTELDYDPEAVYPYAEGPSLDNPKVIREGVVVAPNHERWDPQIGRVKLKAVSAAYLEKY